MRRAALRPARARVGSVVALLVPAAAMATGCTDQGPSTPSTVEVEPPAPTTMEISPTNAVVALNTSIPFSNQVFDQRGQPYPASPLWASADAAVAGVDADGVVTGLRVGHTEISATFQDLRASANVAVFDSLPPTVAFLRPSTQSVVSCIQAIAVETADDDSVDEVGLWIDDLPIGTLDPPSSEHAWDTRSVADGLHRIAALVVDPSGNEGRAEVEVHVENQGVSCGIFAVRPDTLQLDVGVLSTFSFLVDAEASSSVTLLEVLEDHPTVVRAGLQVRGSDGGWARLVYGAGSQRDTAVAAVSVVTRGWVGGAAPPGGRLMAFVEHRWGADTADVGEAKFSIRSRRPLLGGVDSVMVVVQPPDAPDPPAVFPSAGPFRPRQMTKPLIIAMVPRTWTVEEGAYVGETVALDPSRWFNLDERRYCCLFDIHPSARGLLAWDGLPVPIAFRRDRSTGPITAVDSLWFWAALDTVEARFGRDLFTPRSWEAMAKDTTTRGVRPRREGSRSGWTPPSQPTPRGRALRPRVPKSDPLRSAGGP